MDRSASQFAQGSEIMSKIKLTFSDIDMADAEAIIDALNRCKFVYLNKVCEKLSDGQDATSDQIKHLEGLANWTDKLIGKATISNE